MQTDPKLLEKDAQELLAQEKFAEAYRLFKEAGQIYKTQNNHKESALCFASAASTWSLKSGEKTLYNSAISYEEAARQAEVAGDLEYASLIYKYAAISYEKDAELINFSECFYRSKECHRRFLTLNLINPRRIHYIMPSREQKGIRVISKRIFLWFTLTFSYLIWGHGERPARTFYAGIVFIFIAAIFYNHGHLIRQGVIFKPNFFEALYFSVVTFTTVGYGDIAPIGLNRLMVVIEAFSGLFMVSLFVIGLSRKYLRI